MALLLPDNPLAFLPGPLVLLLLYNVLRDEREMRTAAWLLLCGAAMMLAYPVVGGLSAGYGTAGYVLGKMLVFVLLPAGALYIIEGVGVRELAKTTGVGRAGLRESLVFGCIAALVTLVLVHLTSTPRPAPDALWHVLMFLEAFTEEFYFRGVLMVWLAGRTSWRRAFLVSTATFIAAHPQHFGQPFLLVTAVQGVLLALIAHRTGNLAGPWAAHGLNRIVPALMAG